MKSIVFTEHLCYSKEARTRRNIMENELNNGWMGLEAAAKYLDVNKDTIRNWIKKTDIPAHKVGKLWKFKQSELDEWIKSGRSAMNQW